MPSLAQLRDLDGRIPATTDKAMVRRNDGDHGDMLYLADGYVTAWSCGTFKATKGPKLPSPEQTPRSSAILTIKIRRRISGADRAAAKVRAGTGLMVL